MLENFKRNIQRPGIWTQQQKKEESIYQIVYQKIQENVPKMKRNDLYGQVSGIYEVGNLEEYSKQYKSYQIQESIQKISQENQIWIGVRGDGNCFYRSIIILYLLELFKSEDLKQVEEFIQRVKNLKNMSINYEQQMDCQMLQYVLICFLYKLKEIRSKTHINMIDVIKLYNSSPEIDAAAVVICRNLIYKTFQMSKNHPNFSFFIEEQMKELIPEMLLKYCEYAEDIIIPLASQTFKCNLLVQNLYRQSTTSINTEKLPYQPFINASPVFATLNVLFTKGHYESLISTSQVKFYPQFYTIQARPNINTDFKIQFYQEILNQLEREPQPQQELQEKREKNQQNVGLQEEYNKINNFLNPNGDEPTPKQDSNSTTLQQEKMLENSRQELIQQYDQQSFKTEEEYEKQYKSGQYLEKNNSEQVKEIIHQQKLSNNQENIHLLKGERVNQRTIDINQQQQDEEQSRNIQANNQNIVQQIPPKEDKETVTQQVQKANSNQSISTEQKGDNQKEINEKMKISKIIQINKKNQENLNKEELIQKNQQKDKAQINEKSQIQTNNQATNQEQNQKITQTNSSNNKNSNQFNFLNQIKCSQFEKCKNYIDIRKNPQIQKITISRKPQFLCIDCSKNKRQSSPGKDKQEKQEEIEHQIPNENNDIYQKQKIYLEQSKNNSVKTLKEQQKDVETSEKQNIDRKQDISSQNQLFYQYQNDNPQNTQKNNENRQNTINKIFYTNKSKPDFKNQMINNEKSQENLSNKQQVFNQNQNQIKYQDQTENDGSRNNQVSKKTNQDQINQNLIQKDQVQNKKDSLPEQEKPTQRTEENHYNNQSSKPQQDQNENQIEKECQERCICCLKNYHELQFLEKFNLFLAQTKKICFLCLNCLHKNISKWQIDQDLININGNQYTMLGQTFFKIQDILSCNPHQKAYDKQQDHNISVQELNDRNKQIDKDINKCEECLENIQGTFTLNYDVKVILKNGQKEVQYDGKICHDCLTNLFKQIKNNQDKIESSNNKNKQFFISEQLKQRIQPKQLYESETYSLDNQRTDNFKNVEKQKERIKEEEVQEEEKVYEQKFLNKINNIDRKDNLLNQKQTQQNQLNEYFLTQKKYDQQVLKYNFIEDSKSISDNPQQGQKNKKDQNQNLDNIENSQLFKLNKCENCRASTEKDEYKYQIIVLEDDETKNSMLCSACFQLIKAKNQFIQKDGIIIIDSKRYYLDFESYKLQLYIQFNLNLIDENKQLSIKQNPSNKSNFEQSNKIYQDSYCYYQNRCENCFQCVKEDQYKYQTLVIKYYKQKENAKLCEECFLKLVKQKPKIYLDCEVAFEQKSYYIQEKSFTKHIQTIKQKKDIQRETSVQVAIPKSHQIEFKTQEVQEKLESPQIKYDLFKYTPNLQQKFKQKPENSNSIKIQQVVISPKYKSSNIFNHPQLSTQPVYTQQNQFRNASNGIRFSEKYLSNEKANSNNKIISSTSSKEQQKQERPLSSMLRKSNDFQKEEQFYQQAKTSQNFTNQFKLQHKVNDFISEQKKVNQHYYNQKTNFSYYKQ